MERKLEKRCSVTELEVNKRYAIGINGRHTFIVNSINYDRGFILLTYTNSSGNGLIYLDSKTYYYESPLSSLEKELM